jgi:hypothetical protein
MDFESQFGRTMVEAGRSNDIEVLPLIDRGLRRGRVLRGRRVVGAAVGAAAVVALIPIGTEQLTGLSSTSRPASSATETGSGRPSISGTQILGLLKGMLPPGSTSQQQATGAGGGRPYDSPARAQLVYDDGHGKALIQLNSSQKDDTEVISPTACPTGKPSYVVSCRQTRLGDGSTLMVNEETFGTSGLSWTASLVTRAGDQILLQEFNTVTGLPGAPVTRTTPALTTAQLSAIVENSGWAPLFAAERAALPDGQPTQAQVIATARKLQPSGVTFGGNDAMNQEGSAGFPVTKGTNTQSSLTINVQYWPVGAGDEVGQQNLPQPSTTLPDGTVIVTDQRPGNPMTVWDVQILRPDGTDVSLSEQCMHLPNRAVEPPALSMAQLRAIALSPTWDRPAS